MLKTIIEKIQGKLPGGAKRSSKWPAVRKKFLEAYPKCYLCGGIKKLEVHHVRPFHLRPDLELVSTNLITLCEAKNFGVNCHLVFGHLGNYRLGGNLNVVNDADIWGPRLRSHAEVVK